MKFQHPLLLFAMFLAAALQARAADATDQYPRFRFNPLDAYRGGMKYSFLAPGPIGSKTDAFVSVCSGFWSSNTEQSSSNAKQTWSIIVSKKDDPKVADGYNAKDGYTADLARADSGNATPYLYARFQKFSFPWGNAVGYFVQTTKDATWPEPNNAQLIYEIRGVTSDRQDTVVARFVVRHPQLPDGSKVLDAHGNVRTLTSFATYKLLEKSSPESFQPSLTEIQDMVSSVVILKLKKVQDSEKAGTKTG
jgi:hypothetical protein